MVVPLVSAEDLPSIPGRIERCRTGMPLGGEVKNGEFATEKEIDMLPSKMEVYWGMIWDYLGL